MGTRRDWRESIFLKVAVAVFAKTVGFPYLGGALRAGLTAAGWAKAEGLPLPALTFAIEQAAKTILPA